jgi:hypothetical protein
MIPIRLYAYAAVALAIVGLFIHDRWMTKRYEHQKSVTATLTATLAAERDNTRKANEASERYAISLENLKAARELLPVRSVRLCNSRGVQQAAATPGTDAQSDPGHPSEAGFNPGYGSGLQSGQVDRWSDSGPDIGPVLYALADEKDEQLAMCKALQDWVRAR